MKARRKRRPSRRRTGPPRIGGGGPFAGGGGRGYGGGDAGGTSTPEFSRWQGGAILAIVPLMLIMLWLLTRGVPDTSEQALSSDPMYRVEATVTGVATVCGITPNSAPVSITARQGTAVVESEVVKYGQHFNLQLDKGDYTIYAGKFALFKATVAYDGTVAVSKNPPCS